MTGKTEAYSLGKNDIVSEFSCPVDDTTIVYTLTSLGSQLQGFYYCPKCNDTYNERILNFYR